MSSWKKCALGLAVLFGVAARSEASTLTFTFDCTIFNTTPATCGSPTGPFGTLTLTDSLINTNLVNIDLVIYSPPPAGVDGLDKFFLNYDGSISVGGGAINRKFDIVAKDAPFVVDHISLGDVDWGSPNNEGPFNTTLDLNLDPNGSTPSLTFSGALVIYSTNSGHAESDLNVDMFNFKDANNLLWAAFNTLPANQNQQYGATTALYQVTGQPTAVPEPSSLILLGSGLFVVARLASRGRARRE